MKEINIAELNLIGGGVRCTWDGYPGSELRIKLRLRKEVLVTV